MYREEHGDEILNIQMLGGFRVTVGETSLSDTDTRTKQVWHLLQYLIATRHKTPSQEDIIKVMWPGDDIENPANALKNLVYRIRTIFKKHDISAYKNIIVHNRGSYQWNNDILCIVDAEEFEKHCKAASVVSMPKEKRLSEYRKAIDLYKGSYLPGSSSEAWVIPISSYLQTLFFKSVYAKLELLEGMNTTEAYEKIIILCKETLMIDQLEESVHRALINALYKNGEQGKAIEHYQRVSDHFYKELGIGPSENLQALYRKISKTAQNIAPDIKSIQEDLREQDNVDGAFYCEYEVFKNLYRLKARAAVRSGNTMFICLLSVDYNGNDGLSVRNKVMDALKSSITTSLRKGDVFSRFSSVQYVLLLPTVTYENCEMVLGRVLTNFRKNHQEAMVSINAKILPLEPVE